MRNRLNTLYPFTTLLLGLILTQILATVHVYLSNTNLYENLLAIKDAGYLPIPNQHVMDQLHNFGPAFGGGLFFTFSIGAGISFLSLTLAWIWDRLFDRNKIILYLVLLLWIGCLFAVNFHGFKIIVTLYFLLIPPAVFATASACMAHLKKQAARPREVIHIFPVMVLAFILSWQIDSRMFTDFRDIFLFSNHVGSKINSFYYKYTLYPAEVFKSFNQKMLKTSNIEQLKSSETRSLERILFTYDYIPVTGIRDVHLEIVSVEDEFIFKNQGNFVFKINSKEFFAHPAKFIRKFEEKSDVYPVFRQMTFFSLSTGFPLAVYVIVHGLICIILSLFFTLRKSSVIASALCFFFCLILIFGFQLNRSRDVSAKNLAEALNSDRWQDRVAALKIIDEKGLEIRQFQAYPGLLKSPQIAERYWIARTLANSRSPATYNDLLSFLNDTHPNVISMALYALGKRGNKQAITRIMPIIEASNDWYSQWYAYKALRSLGWRQKN